MPFEYALAVFVNLAVEDGFHPGPLKPRSKPPIPAKKEANRILKSLWL